MHPLKPFSSKESEISYKYNEGEILKEITEYVDNTYQQHYSQNKYQATEFIIDSGHGTGFCVGNIQKYAQRYGRKGTPADWRKDMMKVIHYAIMQLYVHDLEYKEKTKPSPTKVVYTPSIISTTTIQDESGFSSGLGITIKKGNNNGN